MKNTIYFLFLMTLTTACKQESEVITISGNYLYYEDAAVLQTPSEIYGVYVDEVVRQLNKDMIKFQKSPTDMVTVKIKAHVSNEKNEQILWENKLRIKEVLTIRAIPQNDVILKTNDE